MAETVPTVTGGALTALDGGPDDMVLLHADGALSLDATPDDIATYQVPGAWPQYVCRLSTITRMLARTDPEHTAAAINGLLARQVAMGALAGPHATPTAAPVPPGNAPVRTGDTAVTIWDV